MLKISGEGLEIGFFQIQDQMSRTSNARTGFVEMEQWEDLGMETVYGEIMEEEAERERSCRYRKYVERER